MKIDPRLLEVSREITVLLVDDSTTNLEYLKKLLEHHEHTILTAGDGKEGIALFREYKPDIVITDIRMPNMSGLEMLKEMNEYRKDFYSIVLTAYDDKEYLKESIDKGVNKFLSKPLDIYEFYETLYSLKTQILYKRKIELQNYLIETIFNSIDCIIILADAEEVYAINEQGLRFFGYDSFEAFKNHHPSISEFFIEKKGSPAKDNWLEDLLSKPEEQRKVHMYSKTEEKEKVFLVTVKELAKFRKYVVIFYDITLQEKQKKEIESLVSLDYLTGAYNRQYFQEILADFIGQYKSDTELKPFALFFLDIDHFKKINDTYGHMTGDEVLVRFSGLIRRFIRNSDIFARWGGEEFVILAPGMNEEQSMAMAERLRKQIQENLTTMELPPVTVSIGVTLFRDGDDVETLLKRVDEAMYKAKEKGRNCWVFV